MMVSIGTYSDTYTVLDIRHVLSRFNADLRALAQVTTCMSEQTVWDIIHDVQSLAENEYLQRIDLILIDALGQKLRARAYIVSTEAWDWSVDLPGGNLWPRTPGGRLDVVLSYSKAWRELSAAQRAEFQTHNQFRNRWFPSTHDLTHAGLTAGPVRRYARNGYGVERRDYR